MENPKIQDLAAALLAVPPDTRRAIAHQHPELAPAMDSAALARLAWPTFSDMEIVTAHRKPPRVPRCSTCPDPASVGLEDKDGRPYCEDCASARWEDWHEGEG